MDERAILERLTGFAAACAEGSAAIGTSGRAHPRGAGGPRLDGAGAGLALPRVDGTAAARRGRLAEDAAPVVVRKEGARRTGLAEDAEAVHGPQGGRAMASARRRCGRAADPGEALHRGAGARCSLGSVARAAAMLLLAVCAAAAADAPPANPQGDFSHKRHAAMKLPCASCHAGAAKSERAGFPAAAVQCKACHTAIDDRKLPSKRVYRLADYVIFSHARHIAGKLECASCHGDVNAAAEVKIERPITMFACVECHKEHKANNTCTACHELGQ